MIAAIVGEIIDGTRANIFRKKSYSVEGTAPTNDMAYGGWVMASFSEGKPRKVARVHRWTVRFGGLSAQHLVETNEHGNGSVCVLNPKWSHGAPKLSAGKILISTPRIHLPFRLVIIVPAEVLNACSPVERGCFLLFEYSRDSVVEQDAVIILNNMSNPETALVVLNYFQKRLRVSREAVLYNVTLKVFRKCKDLDGAESLFSCMLEKGVKPDNVTFSTIISCARQCSLPEKAVEWFEKMPSFGCEPDEVTCSVMVDAYGRVGNVDVALSLYDRARSEKWRLDAVTFSTLIRIYGSMGNFDGCLNLYEEMKALGVRPNASVYNSLLDGMGRAKRPWQAKNIYREMVSSGIEPTWGTYAALIRAYGYEKFSPDSWTFASLITIYSCSGKVEEAEATLAEMLEAGFEPNIFVLTSLVQCYGKAGRTDDIVRTFDRLLELGITPDERFCGCLLNVLTQAPNEDIGKLTSCIEKANPKLGHVVKLLVHGENIEREIFRKEAGELFYCWWCPAKRTAIA
ncbi:UNVERIFIED_CONTAM: Pentatricopeptide repeat-containing protein, chloroplastic [Sesamum calycinum]|uniref:Pentatricopeptide repeat-containing protein, chloroplastic n=1 Tax=Sesamum calycinum TaxID=2727403 RepID=A0AAW2MDX5_9LAMI